MTFNLFYYIKCVLFLEALEPPKIVLKDNTREPIIKSGDSYELVCKGNSPLSWEYPEITVSWPTNYPFKIYKIFLLKGDSKKSTTFDLETSDNASDDQYQSVLRINNMSYPFVGYYTCYYDNFPNTKDQVYLYVNGKHNHANVWFNHFNSLLYCNCILTL